MDKSNNPDFVLRARKDTKLGTPSTRIGAAWHGNMNGKDYIIIKLDPFVVLEGLDEPVLTLFPWKSHNG